MAEQLTYPPTENESAVLNAQADIGVVLIHGIGNIEKGDMSSNFAQGLTTISQGDPSNDLLSAHDAGQHLLDTGHRTVRFYEAHWSKLIREARQPFDFHWVRRLAWYPWLNLVNKQYKAAVADGIRTVLWTPILMLALVGLQLMYRGAVIIVSIWLTLTSGLREGVNPRHQAKALGGNLREVVDDFRTKLPSRNQERPEQGVATAISASQTIDKMLRIVGDVFVYISSAALEHGTPGPSCARRIDELFLDTLREAASDCDELHVVAHSLGTVIAYRCLAHAESRRAEYPWIDKITHLHTMGCPLEKIRFFWPMVLTATAPPPADRLAIQWSNFYDPLDRISGRLIHFDRWGPVENVRLWGLGGPATAHSKALYQRHVQFRRSMADRILRQFYPLRRRAVFRSLQAGKTIFETLAVIFVAALVTALGLVSVGFGPAISMGWIIDEVGWSPWAFVALLSVVPLVLALTSYQQAETEHAEFVQRVGTSEPEP